MNLKGVVVVAAGLIIAALALALAIGAGGSTSVGVVEGSVDPPVEGEAGIVHAKHQTRGLDVFGLTLKAPDRWLSVGAVVDPECIEAGPDGSERFIAVGGCERYADIAGPVVGGGITRDGVSWVGVRVAVPRACFDATEPGDSWPSPNSACQ